ESPMRGNRSAHLTPQERYRADLEREGFTSDPAQAAVVRHTQRLYEELTAAPPKPLPLIDRLLRRGRKAANSPVKGLYLWGGVGRGKTYLVDCFYDCLQRTDKRRIHFHSFMRMVHQELRAAGDITNP